MDSVGNAYCFIDAAGHLLHCNQRYAEISGTSPDSLMGTRLADKVHPDDLPDVSAALRRLTQTPDQRIELEYRLVPANGTPTWVSAGLVNQLDDPRLQAIVVYLRDISMRKATQSALIESERRLTTLLSSLPGMAYRSDNTKAWTVEFVSQGCIELTGYSPEDFIYGKQKAFADLICPADREDVWQQIQAALQARQPFTLTYRIITAEGSVKWVTERGQGLYTASGEVRALEGFIFDITEMRQAEEARRQLTEESARQAKRLEQVVHSVPDGMILLDHRGIITLANPRALEDLALFGPAKVGERLTQLGSYTLEQLLTPPAKGMQHEVQGGDRTFEILAHPVIEPASTGGWVIVLRDVTRERNIQQRLQEQARLAAVGQLAAGIAHDFNNILAVIGLYAEMTRSSPDLSYAQGERLDIIVQQSKRASQLIRQLLDFSRRTYVERHPLDLGPFLKDFTSLLRHALPETITVDLTYPAGSYTVNADPTQIEQALLNLALNARDAMPGGGRLQFKLSSLTFNAAEQAPLAGLEPGTWICVAVGDSGMGIPGEDLAHIFEPFFTTKEPGKGSGLGLAQVHGIVKQHDGEIHVTSQPGRGATFHIYFPALVDATGELTDEEDPMQLPQGTGQRLLLVEDDAATRRALGAALAFLNYQVEQTTDGQTALDLLADAKTPYDLVITDMVMPDLDGMSLLQVLEARYPDLPIIVLTGHSPASLRQAGRGDLPYPWLVKPPTLEALAYTVAHHLGLLS